MSAPDIDALKVFQNQTPALYATAETKEKLGRLAAFLPQWAHMDTIIITRADMEKFDPRLKALYDGRKKGSDLPLAKIFTSFTHQLGYDLKPAIHNSQERHLYDAFLTFEPLAPVHGSVTLGINTVDISAWRNNLCFIHLDEAGQSVQSISGVPPADHKMTLTEGEMISWTAAHEAGHCSQYGIAFQWLAGQNLSQLGSEIDADQAALNVAARDLGMSDEKREELVALRALGVFFNDDPAHGTGVALKMDGAPPDLSLFPDTASKQSQAAKPENSGVQKTWVNEDAIKHIQAGARAHVMAERHVNKKLAEHLLSKDNALLATTIQAMDAKGAFNNSALEKRYVDQFLQAVARYTPNYLRPAGP